MGDVLVATVSNFWCRAVEHVWYEDGPGSLTVRKIHAAAQQLAGPIGLPTFKYVVYAMPGPDGEPLFGSINGVVHVAQDRAVRALREYVRLTEETPDVLNGAMYYVDRLHDHPAHHRMIATHTGPAGHAPDLDDITQRLARLWGNKGRVAAIHGITGAWIAGIIGPTATNAAIKEIVDKADSGEEL